MFRNYILIAFRNLSRQKGFSVINIIGLGVGMACFILILLWVRHEISYDRFNEKADRLYRLVQTQHYTSGPLTTTCMPGPIAADVRKDIPEIINSFMYYVVKGVVNHKDKFFREDIRLADPELFSMFTFTFLKGDPKHVFDDLNSMVITDQMATKYFGNEDPVGKVIKVNSEHSFKVTGVIKETPANSSFRFDFCIPFEYIKKFGFTVDKYGWNTYYCYVELAPGSDYKVVNEKIRNYIILKSANSDDPADDHSNSVIDLFLFPLTKIHLYSVDGIGGDIKYVYIFSVIALFILVIACINFMNLSTARAARRSREIGLRKTAGAGRQQIIIQFIGESMLITVVAFAVSILLVYYFLPGFNQLSDKSLTIEWKNMSFATILIGIVIFVGVLAGSYPAFYLSSLNPINALRKLPGKGKGGSNFRRILVVFQFTLSVIMIICTIVVYKQLAYIRDKKTGMDRDNIVCLTMQGKSVDKYEMLKNEFLQNPNVISITRANSLPFEIGSNSGGFDWEGRNTKDEVLIGFEFSDFSYTQTFGMKMVSGRDFNSSFNTDSASVLINQKTASLMGIEDPIGKWMSWGGTKFDIIGVVEDFHFLDMTSEISPLAIFYAPKYCNILFAKVSGNNPDQTLDYLRGTWEKYNPGFPFEYKYLNDSYQHLYRSEEKLSKIFRYFSILTILISCLGLFGLAAYMAEQRTKEVGIRKVLGANFYNIFRTLSGEFLKWVIIANFIAWPLAYYAMNRWLVGYAYHTNLSVWIFLLTALISILIAMITVSYQAIRTAQQHPVKSLKYE
jgi:ABC-type antimicrobial peptide transport system permease subunit